MSKCIFTYPEGTPCGREVGISGNKFCSQHGTERTYTSAELALNQAAIAREAAALCFHNVEARDAYHIQQAILAIPTDQPALDRYVAERYITREEHNNIIHMNETVHKRDVAERVREALQEVAPIVEFYLKREIEAPANHQEMAREAEGKLRRFRAAARAPETGIGDWARQGLKRGDPAK